MVSELCRAFCVGAAVLVLVSCTKADEVSFVTLEFEPDLTQLDPEMKGELSGKGGIEATIEEEVLERSAKVVQKRLEAGGFENVSAEKGINTPRVLVRLSAGSDVERIKKLLSCRGVLTYHLVASDAETDSAFRAIETRFPKRLVPYLRPPVKMLPRTYLVDVEDVEAVRETVAEALNTQGLLPEGKTIAFGRVPGQSNPNDQVPILFMDAKPCWSPSATFHASAQAATNRGDGTYYVAMLFLPEDGERLGEVTQAHIMHQIAMAVDGVVFSAPVVVSRVSETAMIAGDFSREEAEFFAAVLGSGPLPAPLLFVPNEDPQSANTPLSAGAPER